jgi:hypothetical protein
MKKFKNSNDLLIFQAILFNIATLTIREMRSTRLFGFTACSIKKAKEKEKPVQEFSSHDSIQFITIRLR